MVSNKKTMANVRQNTPTKSRKRFRYFVGTIIISLVVASVALLNRQPIAHAITLATTRLPQGYTELSFNTSPSNPLPTSAPVNKVRSFSFHIVNRENKDFLYSYKVTLGVNGITKTVSSGQVSLISNSAIDIPVTFSAPVSNATILVKVQLAYPDQSIFFRTYS